MQDGLLNHILSDFPFWTGLVSVLLFAYGRFNVSLPDTDELSPPLTPRSFTTAFRFQLAASTYVGFYVAVYMALLFAGSFPALQRFLVSLFGELKTEGETIGTPAWAALVAMAFPALPRFSGVDDRLRLALQDFASIPSKARMLAQEIRSLLHVPEPSDLDDDAPLPGVLAAITAHKERFEQIKETWEHLQQVEQASAYRRYARFFRVNQKILDTFDQEFSADPDNTINVGAARYIERRYRAGVRKAARFMTCAMLEAESTEMRVRSRLQSTGLPVQNMGLDFRPSHIFLNLTVIALATVVGCLLSILSYCLLHQETPAGIISENIFRIMSWALPTMVMYILPVVFAAGVSMFLFDRALARPVGDPDASGADWSDKATAVILTFLGSFGLAFFAALAWVSVTQALSQQTGPVMALQILPWGLPPAAVASVFVIMSTRRWEKPTLSGRQRFSEATLYVACHAAAAAVASGFALMLAYAAGMVVSGFPTGMVNVMAPTIAACVGGSIGWVLSDTRWHGGRRTAISTAPTEPRTQVAPALAA